LELADHKFGRIPSGQPPDRPRIVEPEQVGERRVLLERPGATAYLKAAWHAPAVTEPDFLPMLVLDAVLTGAKGLNVWSSFRGPTPQRKARLYTALVERGLASTVSGALLPTTDPFLYSIALTATEGVELSRLDPADGDAAGVTLGGRRQGGGERERESRPGSRAEMSHVIYCRCSSPWPTCSTRTPRRRCCCRCRPAPPRRRARRRRVRRAPADPRPRCGSRRRRPG